MGRITIFLLIRHIYLLMLFALIPCTGFAATEKPTSPNDCLKCHKDLWQKEMAKRYIHAPFLEKKCTGCHAASIPVNDEEQGTTDPCDLSGRWTGKSLIPATNHWFEFKTNGNPSTMILEAAYGSMVRVYREIPIPPLDDLIDIVDAYGQTPPEIYNVNVMEVKKDIFLTASISWQTDRPTGSMITYGVENLRQTTPMNGRLRTDHLETLSSLKHGQTYQFRITAEDAVGNRTESDIFEFNTADTFSKPVEEPVADNCCLATPLGLESNFFRKGDQYLININIIRPVRIFFSLERNDNIATEDPDMPPDLLAEQLETTKHIITNEEEIITIIVCKRCHRDFVSHHPVNVYPKKGMKIPSDYPTMADGRISCISCHAPHASNLNYRMIKDHRQELCIGCHNQFSPSDKHTADKNRNKLTNGNLTLNKLSIN